MKRETITRMLNSIDDDYISETAVFDPGTIQEPSERIAHMKKKIITIVLAAALMLALAATAFAVWSIHAKRQQELKADLKIEENNVSSYMEYAVPDDPASGLVLLSSVNDGDLQRVYVNISPVSENEASAFPDSYFSWRFEGTECTGFAAPQLRTDSALGADAIREAVMRDAYDAETETLTLECYVDVMFFEKAIAILETDNLPFTVTMSVGDVSRRFGPVSLTLSEKQSRYFDFEHAIYHDEEYDRDIEMIGLELTSFSAVWKVNYDGAESFHTPSWVDMEAYEPWMMLEDKVCLEAKIIFSDGSEFSTGGPLTTPYEDGALNQHCGWGSAINIDDVQRIVLGDLVLWEATQAALFGE